MTNDNDNFVDRQVHPEVPTEESPVPQEPQEPTPDPAEALLRGVDKALEPEQKPVPDVELGENQPEGIKEAFQQNVAGVPDEPKEPGTEIPLETPEIAPEMAARFRSSPEFTPIPGEAAPQAPLAQGGERLVTRRDLYTGEEKEVPVSEKAVQVPLAEAKGLVPELFADNNIVGEDGGVADLATVLGVLGTKRLNDMFALAVESGDPAALAKVQELLSDPKKQAEMANRYVTDLYADLLETYNAYAEELGFETLDIGAIRALANRNNRQLVGYLNSPIGQKELNSLLDVVHQLGNGRRDSDLDYHMRILDGRGHLNPEYLGYKQRIASMGRLEVDEDANLFERIGAYTGRGLNTGVRYGAAIGMGFVERVPLISDIADFLAGGEERFDDTQAFLEGLAPGGETIGSVVSFFGGYGAASKAMKGLNWLQASDKAGKLGNFGRMIMREGLAGAAADLALSLPEDQSISDALLQAFPETAGQYVPDLFTTDDENEWVDTAKITLEGFLAGVAIDTGFSVGGFAARKVALGATLMASLAKRSAKFGSKATSEMFTNKMLPALADFVRKNKAAMGLTDEAIANMTDKELADILFDVQRASKKNLDTFNPKTSLGRKVQRYKKQEINWTRNVYDALGNLKKEIDAAAGKPVGVDIPAVAAKAAGTGLPPEDLFELISDNFLALADFPEALHYLRIAARDLGNPKAFKKLSVGLDPSDPVRLIPLKPEVLEQEGISILEEIDDILRGMFGVSTAADLTKINIPKSLAKALEAAADQSATLSAERFKLAKELFEKFGGDIAETVIGDNAFAKLLHHFEDLDKGIARMKEREKDLIGFLSQATGDSKKVIRSSIDQVRDIRNQLETVKIRMGKEKAAKRAIELKQAIRKRRAKEGGMVRLGRATTRPEIAEEVKVYNKAIADFQAEKVTPESYIAYLNKLTDKYPRFNKAGLLPEGKLTRQKILDHLEAGRADAIKRFKKAGQRGAIGIGRGAKQTTVSFGGELSKGVYTRSFAEALDQAKTSLDKKGYFKLYKAYINMVFDPNNKGFLSPRERGVYQALLDRVNNTKLDGYDKLVQSLERDGLITPKELYDALVKTDQAKILDEAQRAAKKIKFEGVTTRPPSPKGELLDEAGKPLTRPRTQTEAMADFDLGEMIVEAGLVNKRGRSALVKPGGVALFTKQVLPNLQDLAIMNLLQDIGIGTANLFGGVIMRGQRAVEVGIRAARRKITRNDFLETVARNKDSFVKSDYTRAKKFYAKAVEQLHDAYKEASDEAWNKMLDLQENLRAKRVVTREIMELEDEAKDIHDEYLNAVAANKKMSELREQLVDGIPDAERKKILGQIQFWQGKFREALGPNIETLDKKLEQYHFWQKQIVGDEIRQLRKLKKQGKLSTGEWRNIQKKIDAIRKHQARAEEVAASLERVSLEKVHIKPGVPGDLAAAWRILKGQEVGKNIEGDEMFNAWDALMFRIAQAGSLIDQNAVTKNDYGFGTVLSRTHLGKSDELAFDPRAISRLQSKIATIEDPRARGILSLIVNTLEFLPRKTLAVIDEGMKASVIKDEFMLNASLLLDDLQDAEGWKFINRLLAEQGIDDVDLMADLARVYQAQILAGVEKNAAMLALDEYIMEIAGDPRGAKGKLLREYLRDDLKIGTKMQMAYEDAIQKGRTITLQKDLVKPDGTYSLGDIFMLGLEKLINAIRQVPGGRFATKFAKTSGNAFVETLEIVTMGMPTLSRGLRGKTGKAKFLTKDKVWVDEWLSKAVIGAGLWTTAHFVTHTDAEVEEAKANRKVYTTEKKTANGYTYQVFGVPKDKYNSPEYQAELEDWANQIYSRRRDYYDQQAARNGFDDPVEYLLSLVPDPEESGDYYEFGLDRYGPQAAAFSVMVRATKFIQDPNSRQFRRGVDDSEGLEKTLSIVRDLLSASPLGNIQDFTRAFGGGDVGLMKTFLLPFWNEEKGIASIAGVGTSLEKLFRHLPGTDEYENKIPEVKNGMAEKRDILGRKRGGSVRKVPGLRIPVQERDDFILNEFEFWQIDWKPDTPTNIGGPFGTVDLRQFKYQGEDAARKKSLGDQETNHAYEDFLIWRGQQAEPLILMYFNSDDYKAVRKIAREYLEADLAGYSEEDLYALETAYKEAVSEVRTQVNALKNMSEEQAAFENLYTKYGEDYVNPETGQTLAQVMKTQYSIGGAIRGAQKTPSLEQLLDFLKDD